jgi:hypothetical protein
MDDSSTFLPGNFKRFFPALIAVVIALLVLAISPMSAQDAPNSFDPKSAPDNDVAPRAIPTDFWAVKIAPGTDPNVVAAANGFINLGPIAVFKNQYLFQAISDRVRAAPAQATASLRATAGVLKAKRQKIQPRFTRQSFSDPLYPNQWHLRNTGQGGGTVGQDANVVPAWNAGYTGTGVVVSSVDDGLWTNSPDLIPNYLASASWDYVGMTATPAVVPMVQPSPV